MKKILLSLAALSPLLAVEPAWSFPTNRNLTIEVESSSVGRIRARSRVEDDGDSCLYTLSWTITTPPLGRTVRCDIREFKASNAFDCEENRRGWVTTFIENESCRGFDEFGQQTRVRELVGGESRRGVNGVFYAVSVGDTQSFTIR